MATQIVSPQQRASRPNAPRSRLVAEVKAGIPEIDHARSADEVEFLMIYRMANDADKKRIMKLCHAAKANMLPSIEERHAMTLDQVRAFADALPDVAS